MSGTNRRSGSAGTCQILPTRFVIILRGAGFEDVRELDEGRYECWKVGERYVVDDSGEVIEGGRLADGLQSFLDKYYTPDSPDETD